MVPICAKYVVVYSIRQHSTHHQRLWPFFVPSRVHSKRPCVAAAAPGRCFGGFHGAQCSGAPCWACTAGVVSGWRWRPCSNDRACARASEVGWSKASRLQDGDVWEVRFQGVPTSMTRRLLDTRLCIDNCTRAVLARSDPQKTWAVSVVVPEDPTAEIKFRRAPAPFPLLAAVTVSSRSCSPAADAIPVASSAAGVRALRLQHLPRTPRFSGKHASTFWGSWRSGATSWCRSCPLQAPPAPATASPEAGNCWRSMMR